MSPADPEPSGSPLIQGLVGLNFPKKPRVTGCGVAWYSNTKISDGQNNYRPSYFLAFENSKGKGKTRGLVVCPPEGSVILYTSTSWCEGDVHWARSGYTS